MSVHFRQSNVSPQACPALTLGADSAPVSALPLSLRKMDALFRDRADNVSEYDSMAATVSLEPTRRGGAGAAR